MKINSNISALNFGTKIKIQKQEDLREYIAASFPKDMRAKFCEPMCDFWTVIDEMPAKIGQKPKNPKQKDISEYKNKKYKATKNIFGATYDIDICSAGVVVGNNGKIAMFHIAPTLDNYDLLIKKNVFQRDCFGKSIDDFSKKANGIKKAIIVGGKTNNQGIGEYSTKVNNLIRQRFSDRNIPTTILSDFKNYTCDILYSSGNDTLHVGVLGTSNTRKLGDVFAQVQLQKGDFVVMA